MLFILDASNADQAALDRARDILRREVDHPSKTVFVARDDGPGVAELVQNASMAADRPWRVVLWVKNRAVFPAGKEAELFASDANTSGVVLDFADRVIGRFTTSASIIDLDDAFRRAERGQ